MEIKGQKPEFVNNPVGVVDPSQVVTVNVVDPDASSSMPFTDVTLSTAFVFIHLMICSPELVYCPNCHKNVMTKVQNTSM